MTATNYDLHQLGWKAFQDLCLALAEECLKRPVQQFLPSNDGGRDGAFVGTWAEGDGAGSSTIQCKFTSLPHEHLSLSGLQGELEKVTALAARGLAEDYVILTNHPVSGKSEEAIVAAFQSAGAKRCRVFGKDWIIGQIQQSARLRMLVPRLYGLGDLGQILDVRAYEQASMILSSMGDDLKKLVVTDAHRKSVQAISTFNFVLLLGAPAAGKSTIGASLAVGAADVWKSFTIRATTPAEIQQHLNPNERQFFWIDDAWGSTQYQRQTIEAWNQVLPLIAAAAHKGTQFLLTSRDYIWAAAKRDLKMHALPILGRSQVVINVQELLTNERAQILYNHIKLGDQPAAFRTAIKPSLPALAVNPHFLPETARRLGMSLFSSGLSTDEASLVNFVEKPADFLVDTIQSLGRDCKAALGLIFVSGGRVLSPVPDSEMLQLATNAFGANAAETRDALGALNNSLTLLAHDQGGRYWTLKHPTIGDAFASLISNDPELTAVYLHGAKAEVLMKEVVCSGVELRGAPVTVPRALYHVLLDRIRARPVHELASFVSYRSDSDFAEMLLGARPDLLSRLSSFFAPVSEDPDSSLLVQLHRFGLLPEANRERFVEVLLATATEYADASFIDDDGIRSVLTDEEVGEISAAVYDAVFKDIDGHVDRVRREWDSSYDPDDYFDSLSTSVERLAAHLLPDDEANAVRRRIRETIYEAIEILNEEYTPIQQNSAPTVKTSSGDSALAAVFRDVDD